MFSSNQIMKISGDFSQLRDALAFALHYEGSDKNMTRSEIERGCKLLYQTTNDGKYCIGWGFESVPNGWNEYQFDFDYDIVSKIIIQFLKKQPNVESGYEDYDGCDGDGFLMRCIDSIPYEEKENIIEDFYGIVCFERYKNFYAK